MVAVSFLPTGISPVEAAPTQNKSLKELQAERQAVRSKKAAQASQVDALKASDAEVSAALATLTANVTAQQDRVEEAERAVTEANRQHEAALEAQAQKQRELDELVAEMKSSAVDAYVTVGRGDSMASASSGDVNDTVKRRTLLGMKANENIDTAERFRSVQEDLEAERVAAETAAQRAEDKKAEVRERMAELQTAYDQQQAFAAQIEQRLDAALAEADALASLDSELSSSISAKQAEIAKAAAAQRAAQEARAARSASQASNVTRSGGGGGGSSSGGGGGGGGGFSPSIVGAGEIVSVGGIRVHRSIAGNVQGLLSAASAAGIQLSGGGYRDPSGQIAVRRNNCGSSHYAIYEMPASSCSPPTARPGRSMHERGLAIDFTHNGRTLTRSSPAFAWLKANAARFGLYNLPSEPWHWSTNGN